MLESPASRYRLFRFSSSFHCLPNMQEALIRVRNPYFRGPMLAKMTAKNQLTLPKTVTDAVGPTYYFDVETRNGQIILTPVRIQVPMRCGSSSLTWSYRNRTLPTL